MRPFLLIPLALLLTVYNGYAQTQYTGTVTLIPKGPDMNATYYLNKMSMTVDAGGNAVLVPHLKFGPTSDPGDYVAFEGTLNGMLQGGELSLSGTLHQSMQDGPRFLEDDITTRVSGQLSGNTISGTFYMRYDGKEESTWTFTLRGGEQVPELLFPLGKSPKVFDKGWLFGASFKIMDKDNNEVDLSEQVQWSGTGSFEPDKGPASRPSFSNTGENKIILTVEYEGKKYKKEYPVITVNANNYARIGSLAKAPSDAHGCVGCSHTVMGPIITGNANVLINGIPVACEGDRGVHAACCGPNNYVITDGDDEVLLNGKRVAKGGSYTRHCGGAGQIVSLSGHSGYDQELQALSSDVSLSKDGKALGRGGKAEKGTTMKTGPKGMLLMSPDRNTVMMLWPNSDAVIKDASGNDMTISLNNGTVSVNGDKSEKGRNLLIETFGETLARKGTRFLFTHSKEESRLIVYDGEVELRLKNDNSLVTVPAGKVYINDFKNPYRLEDTALFQAASLLEILPKDTAYWQPPKSSDGPKGAEQQKDFLSFLKQYWYIGAGLLGLIGALFLLRKKKPTGVSPKK